MGLKDKLLGKPEALARLRAADRALHDNQAREIAAGITTETPEYLELNAAATAAAADLPLWRRLTAITDDQRGICQACGHPATDDDRLVTADGYRIHHSHTTDPRSGFYRRAKAEGPAWVYLLLTAISTATAITVGQLSIGNGTVAFVTEVAITLGLYWAASTIYQHILHTKTTKGGNHS